MLSAPARLSLLASLPWLVSGCLIKPKPPVFATLPTPVFTVHNKPNITKDGMTVTVMPINAASMQRFPQVHRLVNVTVPVQQTDVLGNPTGRTVQRTIQVPMTVVPIPAFQVRIANNTGHVLRFTQAVFRLQDNTGKQYPTFASTAELQAWLEASMNASMSTNPHEALLKAQLLQKEGSAISSLQLLNRSVELLKGDQWTGYLIFNLPTGTEHDYQSFINSVQRLTLRMAEIPVATDQADKVTRTAEFDFIFDKGSQPVKAKCPAGTKHPSWNVCSTAR